MIQWMLAMVPLLFQTQLQHLEVLGSVMLKPSLKVSITLLLCEMSATVG